MIYRTHDMECQNGNSEVTFHSLSYVKKTTGTLYFIATACVVVPPTEFLGDNEERQIHSELVYKRQGKLPPTTISVTNEV